MIYETNGRYIIFHCQHLLILWSVINLPEGETINGIGNSTTECLCAMDCQSLVPCNSFPDTKYLTSYPES